MASSPYDRNFECATIDNAFLFLYPEEAGLVALGGLKFQPCDRITTVERWVWEAKGFLGLPRHYTTAIELRPDDPPARRQCEIECCAASLQDLLREHYRTPQGRWKQALRDLWNASPLWYKMFWYRLFPQPVYEPEDDDASKS
jgi:hypothetical protein